MCSLASAPAREPNAEGNADAGEEENLPGDEEPFEKGPDQFNRVGIPTVPRTSTQMFENRGDRGTAQLVLARENAEVGAVRVCSVHGRNIVTPRGEPVRVGSDLR